MLTSRTSLSACALFSLTGGLALAGCSAAPQEDAVADDAALSDLEAPLGYVGKNVARTLLENPKTHVLEHRLWEVTARNTLPDGWLVPTFGSASWGPALASLPTGTDCTTDEAGCDPDFLMRTCSTDRDCPSGSCRPFGPTVTKDGEPPASLCLGYADWWTEAFYDGIVGAREQVDISSLWLPGERFAPAIRNALRRVAARKGPTLTVRILGGDVTDFSYLAKRTTAANLALLTKGLPADAPLRVYVALESAATTSWNHSKIIATDGAFGVVGGHNMHTSDYQLKDPVMDLSMRLSGPAIASAHRYTNELWDLACRRGNAHGLGLVTFPDGLDCPGHYEPPSRRGDGDVSVIAVGRKGAEDVNPSDDALLAMVDAARETVVMSQEDILGGRIPRTTLSVAPPPRVLIERLAAAIGRGVDVYLVTSNVDGGLFTTSYSHGWTAAETAQQMADIMKARPDLFEAGTDIPALLCQKLHVAGLRLDDGDRWASGKVFSNHTKFLMVDTKAFYIGSQNLYVSDLAELGYIVDDEAAALQARESFWTPMWKYSGRDASTGSEAKSCVIE
ncbi:MAG: hypothetical protein JWP97_3167 [Labilithrix sp.]|nr:hypothetical protein [Labilithrix sp.]